MFVLYAKHCLSGINSPRIQILCQKPSPMVLFLLLLFKVEADWTLAAVSDVNTAVFLWHSIYRGTQPLSERWWSFWTALLLLLGEWEGVQRRSGVRGGQTRGRIDCEEKSSQAWSYWISNRAHHLQIVSTIQQAARLPVEEQLSVCQTERMNKSLFWHLSRNYKLLCVASSQFHSMAPTSTTHLIPLFWVAGKGTRAALNYCYGRRRRLIRNSCTGHVWFQMRISK